MVINGSRVTHSPVSDREKEEKAKTIDLALALLDRGFIIFISASISRSPASYVKGLNYFRRVSRLDCATKRRHDRCATMATNASLHAFRRRGEGNLPF